MNNVLRQILSQKIGVFYKDREWTYKIFDQIIEEYPSDYIFRCRHSSSDMSIQFTDGTEVRFVLATESCKGQCFSKVIMQPGIDEDIVNSIIRPQLKDFRCRYPIVYMEV